MILYYGLGLIGTVIIWALYKVVKASDDHEKVVWCPSPRGILLILLFSAMGPVVLAIAVAACLTSLAIKYDYKVDAVVEWFKRPICQKPIRANNGVEE